ncbi:class I adenylate-forming enzyme family protein [uncultured Nostoc sp.]|uniref:class I adenylate-forming enzyme family protein n=1 Tax=uncultured Nostoc sp. TaxID=340711 RepID=UPI0035CAB711
MLVNSFLEKTAERSPNQDALIFQDKKLTYIKVENFANSLGNALLELGLHKQERVAIYLENSIESVISIFGILKAGGIFLIINPQTKLKKLQYILEDCQVKFLITDTQLLLNYKGISSSLKSLLITDANQEIVSKVEQVTIYSFWNLISQCSIERPNITCIDIDLCSLIYTSGSTGNPKGVMLTHLNMVTAANSIIEYLENTAEDIILNCLPLSFDYGLYNILMPFKFGGTVVLEKTFIYPFQIIKLINTQKITGLPLVPTVIAILLQFKNLDKYNFSPIRYITSTGQSLPLKHILELSKLCPQAKIYSMYGLTECKRVSYLPPEQLLNRPTSVGKAIPNTEVYIVNQHGDKISQSGQIGELIVRGSHVMQGYWNLPEETAKFLQLGIYPGEKSLRTGDLFRMDEEGYLYFVARKDDVIKIGGERVSTKEIENILYEIEEVNEVAVFALEHEILGYIIKICLVLKDGASLTENDIREYCALHLEKHMIPKYIEILEILPKTQTGKISYKELRLLHQ